MLLVVCVNGLSIVVNCLLVFGCCIIVACGSLFVVSCVLVIVPKVCYCLLVVVCRVSCGCCCLWFAA